MSVVEATPITFASKADAPNSSAHAISTLLACGNGLASERCIACSLEDLAPSPFYNMLFRGQPVDKALVLLHFTQRSKGAQVANGFRMVTEGAKDGTNLQHTNKYITIACCSVEVSPDFTAAKETMALAVVCKLMKSQNEQHVAECYIESMEAVGNDQQTQAVATLQELQRVKAICAKPEQISGEAAWQQRKCRRLTRYPTEA